MRLKICGTKDLKKIIDLVNNLLNLLKILT